ncbi:MAG: hypothetical protein ACYDDA_09125 [Acidiferrobacteraceae bacterium]
MIRYVTRWALSTGIKTVAFEDLDKAKADAKNRAQAKAKRLLAQSQALSDPRWQPKICE